MEEKEDTIYLNSRINEIYGTTELTQYFTNPLDNAIELSISFPIKEEISLTKFVVTIGEKVVLSKVMPKEKAEEKYSDSMASGNQGFISSYDEQMTYYSVNIGNINPKQKIKLNTIFIQNLGSQDMSYEFDIMEKYPTFHYKELNKNEARNKIIKANFIIETQSKITRLIAPFLDEEAKKKSTYEVAFSNDFKKADIKYVKNPDDQKNKNVINQPFLMPGHQGGFPGQVNQPTFYSSFCLLFRTENMNKPILFYQYNPELKETAYSINYVYPSKSLKNIPVPTQPDQDNKISYYSKYESNMVNETPGLFIFLIDQSGSMRGKSIDLVKQALLLFIQSLPAGSYFQLIGFGTSFKKYNEEPVEYNQANVSNIINVINDLNANMGGTNISGPLDAVYKDTNYSKINLSKNIFLLTDGQVHDRDQCVNLITTNANKFRIHALGIGSDFDKVLIERSGKLGKGSSSFVENVEKINSAVIDTLNKCLRPYITDIQFNFQNYQNNNNNALVKCNPINNFTYQDEIMNYSFILDDKNKIDIDNLPQSIKIEITGKDPKNPIKENVSFINNQNIIKLENGEEMSKMIVGKALKNNKELINDEKKEIEFAKKYQILSKNTALYAEILNDNNTQTKLIKVNLNDYQNQRIGGMFGGGFKPLMFSMAPMGGGPLLCNAAPRMAAPRMMNNNINLLGSVKMARPQMMINKSAAPKMKASMDYCKISNNMDMNKMNMIKMNNNMNMNNNFNNNFNNNMNINSGNNNKIKDNMTRLIMSQDIIEGAWNENEETKKLISIITQNKFNNIKNKVKGLNKGANENKIIFTILVIYYLGTHHSDKLNDYRLVINKAKKFLMNQGIQYEDFIQGI